MMWIIIGGIVVVIGFVGYFLGFFTTGVSYTKEQKQAACLQAPNLPFCEGGSQTFSFEDETAKKSTEALACAVNAMAVGKELECVKKLSAEEANVPSVKCFNRDQLICCNPGLTKGRNYWTTSQECLSKQGTPIGDLISASCKDSVGGFLYEEKRPELKCIVKNFNLPQKVEKAEEWIPYYGDPKYLVYWQKFPIDEDTWTYKSDWKIHALLGVVSVAPPLRVGGVIAKSGLLKAASSTKFGANLITKYGGETALKSLASKQIGKNFLKESMREVIAERLKSGKFLLTIGAGEAASKIAKVVDSVLSKYDPKPGKMVLKSPSFVNEKTFQFDISKEAETMPVLLKFKPKASQEFSTAHLASPCRIATLPVKETEVLCSAYSFNSETKEVACHTPKELADGDKSSRQTCQDFENYMKLENEFAQSFIDYLKQLRGSEIPSSLRNYLTDRDIGGGQKETTIIAKALIHKGVFLEIYGRNAILKDSDRIIFETSKGPVDIKINNPAQRPDGVWTGDATYDKATIHISKACKGDDKYKDVDKYFENDSNFEKLSCLVSLTFIGDCTDGSEVCEKFNGLQLELATTKDGLKNVKFKFDLQKEPPDPEDNGRRIEVSNDNYKVEYLDMDYDNVFESIVITYGKGSTWQILKDADFDKRYESFELGNCKTEAVYVDAVAAEKKEGYCVRNVGKVGLVAQYGGYALLGAGTIAAIGSGVGVVGSGVAATTGTLFAAGSLVESLGEVTELFYDIWPKGAGA